MTKTEVLNFFGGVAKTAQALGTSAPAISKWSDPIPMGRAYQIEVLTGGQLKAIPETTNPKNEAAQ